MVFCSRAIVLLTMVMGNSDFWSKVNDESIDDVMQNSPGFRQMIQSTCEMITLGRAGYPKNIPKNTVDKLCTKMYPPFANKDKPRAAAAGGKKDGPMSQFNAVIMGVVILGMLAYVWSASAPAEVINSAPPPVWAINKLAQDQPQARSPASGAGSPALGASSPPVLTPSTSPAMAVPQSPSSPELTPSPQQVLEQRRARLSRFDSENS